MPKSTNSSGCYSMFRRVLIWPEMLEFGVPKCLILDKFNLTLVKLANVGTLD